MIDLRRGADRRIEMMTEIAFDHAFVGADTAEA